MERLLVIVKFLHFSDETTTIHKLYKIEKLLNLYKVFRKYAHLVEIFPLMSLLLWERILGWKLYISIKRAKFDIKIFMLSEAKSSYLYNFIAHFGKRINIPINIPNLDPFLTFRPSKINFFYGKLL